MTLRLRLVVALVLMLTVGLSTFGVVMTSFYARSQYQRLDERLRSAAPFATARLRTELGLGGGFGFDTPNRSSGDGPNGPPTALAPDTYVEIRDGNDDVLGTGTILGATATPDLPAHLTSSSGHGVFLTVSSATGSGDWRVLVMGPDRFTGTTSIIAVPLTEVSGPLNRLIVIEVLSAAGLLALLGAGSWLILRRGLRPLEQMANSASSITSGNLAERVSPSDSQTEVGQLGLALNTMLAEIEQAFRERDATEQRLRQFLADASHELRTPLTSIQGFAELFRMGAAEDRAKLAVILRRIEEESDRMKVLVEELLLLARLDETRPPERVDVDLAVLAADACSDASATAPDRAVTLVAPEPVVINGDRDHLRQAIANLVTNALRHTPPGTPIEVGAAVDGDDAVVTVRDHGSGLDDVALAHAFDRFWRADSARVGSGTGLGLAIVSAIADEHDGTVTVANEPDGGACFRIRLPRAATAPAPA
ncbi:MAG: HAMP domain-containing sensor histidine kinase [Acidimicrobiales bacterium]